MTHPNPLPTHTKDLLKNLHRVHSGAAFQGWLQCVPSATQATPSGSGFPLSQKKTKKKEEVRIPSSSSWSPLPLCLP